MIRLRELAGYGIMLVAVVTVGCAFHPPVLRGRAESESLPANNALHLRELVIPDLHNAEQLEHEIRTAFMIAAARAEASGRIGAVDGDSSDGAASGAGFAAGPEVSIRLDRRPYTRGMRRQHILTLTLQLSQPTRGAVAVVNRRINESTPSFLVIRAMTAQALRRALKELE